MATTLKSNDGIQDYDNEVIVKAILGGSWAVGKTSLRRRYLGHSFDSTYKHTFGADFALKITSHQHDNGTTYRIAWQLWDIAGQPTFAALRSMYFYGARAALVLYDVTRPETLAEAEKWIYEIWEHSGASSRIPIILVGNKIDLREENGKRQGMLSPEDGLQLATMLGISHVETSAKTGENVDVAFDLLAKEVLETVIRTIQ